MKLHRNALAGTMLVLAGTCAFAQAPQYNWQSLPGPHGADVYATVLGSTGSVGGGFEPYFGFGESVAVIDGKVLTWQIGSARLSYVTGIDRAGNTAGNAGSGSWIRWADGRTTVLRMADGSSMIAYAMNDEDVVVGTRRTNAGNSAAVVWKHGRATDLPAPAGSFFYVQPEAINDAGTIVGYGSDAAGGHGFAWIDGQLQELPALYTNGSAPVAISSTGTIAGSSNVAPGADGVSRVHACVWRNGQITDLGVPAGGVHSQATGVNASGDTVGKTTDSTFEPLRGFLWRGGDAAAAVALDTLVALPAGWTIVEANAINDAGQILAVAQGDGKSFALLLTPTGR